MSVYFGHVKNEGSIKNRKGKLKCLQIQEKMCMELEKKICDPPGETPLGCRTKQKPRFEPGRPGVSTTPGVQRSNRLHREKFGKMCMELDRASYRKQSTYRATRTGVALFHHQKLYQASFSSANREEKHCIRIPVAFRLYLVKII
jgi:hypothetical protein